MMVMKNKSIDDIFEGIDLNDEELLKEAEEVDNFKVDDVNQLKDSKNICYDESSYESSYAFFNIRYLFYWSQSHNKSRYD